MAAQAGGRGGQYSLPSAVRPGIRMRPSPRAVSGDGAPPSPFRPHLYAFALLLAAAHAACPGAAAPGSFCAGAVETLCPVGAWCAGGAFANAPCYPAAACAVAGLSAQPPCYWNVSTLAGNGTAGFADGLGGVLFNSPRFAAFNGSALLVADNINKRVRKVDVATGSTTTLWLSSSFVSGIAFDDVGGLFAHSGSNVSKSSNGGAFISTQLSLSESTQTASLSLTRPTGFGSQSACFCAARAPPRKKPPSPPPLALTSSYHSVKLMTPTGSSCVVAAGNDTAGFVDGPGAIARFNQPWGLATDGIDGSAFVCANGWVRRVALADFLVSSVIQRSCSGIAYAGALNGFVVVSSRYVGLISRSGNAYAATQLSSNTLTAFSNPGISVDPFGLIAILDGVASVLLAQCVPSPPGTYTLNGVPTPCPAGAYWNTTQTLYYNTSCAACPAGTFSKSAGATSCQACPGGHFCPPGSSSWAQLNCGRGSYCPEGSTAPIPCPAQTPPPPLTSWAQHSSGMQGPAFMLETAGCLNHCFWNFSSGNGQLSKC